MPHSSLQSLSQWQRQERMCSCLLQRAWERYPFAISFRTDSSYISEPMLPDSCSGSKGTKVVVWILDLRLRKSGLTIVVSPLLGASYIPFSFVIYLVRTTSLNEESSVLAFVGPQIVNICRGGNFASKRPARCIIYLRHTFSCKAIRKTALRF